VVGRVGFVEVVGTCVTVPSPVWEDAPPLSWVAMTTTAPMTAAITVAAAVIQAAAVTLSPPLWPEPATLILLFCPDWGESNRGADEAC
jgi:hypothetical protein